MSATLDRLKPDDKPLLEWLKERYPTEKADLFGECLVVPLSRFPKEYEEQLRGKGLRIRYQGWHGETCAFIKLSNSPEQSSHEEEEAEKTQRPEAPSSIGESADDSKPVRKRDHPWSLEEREQLRALLIQNVPMNEIAAKIGRSIFSCNAELRYLPDFKSRRYKRKVQEKPSSLKTDAGNAADKSRGSHARGLVKPEAIKKPSGVWTPEREKAVRELHDQDKSPKEIADRLGVSVFAVSAKLRFLRKPQPKSQEKPDSTSKGTTPQTNDDDDVVKEMLQAASALYPNYRRACALLIKTAEDRMGKAT